MWVHVTPPADWPTVVTAEGASARRPAGGLTLAWSRLRPLPEKQAPWVMEVLSRELPAGASLVEVERALTETHLGWPMLLVQAKVLVAGEDAPRAARVAAFYAFLEHGGHALVHADDPHALAAEEESLRRILFEATPDFRGPLSSIDDFYRQ